MSFRQIFGCAAIALFTLPLAQAQSDQMQGQAVITVLPRHDGEVAPSVANQDLSVKVNGKPARVTSWAAIKSPNDSLELVVLIDNAARGSLGGQMQEIAHFIKALPPNTRAAIAYMENGRALFAGPLSADHDEVLRALHLPGGSVGSNSSPYFCLSDLARRWPSNNGAARREVLMLTDGVDNFQQQFDPGDPYVEAAITDAVRAHLVVYSIYWQDRGRAGMAQRESNGGQSFLEMVSSATGGRSFWSGIGNPVSLAPFLDDLTRRLRNQYELSFVGRGDGKTEVDTFKLNLKAPDTEIDAPKEVVVAPVSGDAK